MEQTTLIIGLILGLIILKVKREISLAIFFAGLIWYPYYLSFMVGSLNFTLIRLLILFLLLKLFNINSRFNSNKIDRYVLIWGIVTLIIPLLTYTLPISKVLENKSGLLMNTVLVYFITRMCIQTKKELISFSKAIVLILVPYAILGIMESIYHWQPFIIFKHYMPPGWVDPGTGISADRFGMARAYGPTGNPIMFGIIFMIMAPFLNILKNTINKINYLTCLILIAFGAMSSLSSGPLMLLLIYYFIYSLQKIKHIIKPLLWTFAFGIVSVAIISNRPFYHVIASYANPFGGAYWHRAKLIDLTIHNFNEWFLSGYGGNDPGWGPELGARWTDITNHFIAVATSYGLAGLVIFCTIIFLSIKYSIRILKQNPECEPTIWPFITILVSLCVVLNSCTLFSQALTCYYIVLGVNNFLITSAATKV
jgi:hypothetical protein